MEINKLTDRPKKERKNKTESTFKNINNKDYIKLNKHTHTQSQNKIAKKTQKITKYTYTHKKKKKKKSHRSLCRHLAHRRESSSSSFCQRPTLGRRPPPPHRPLRLHAAPPPPTAAPPPPTARYACTPPIFPAPVDLAALFAFPRTLSRLVSTAMAIRIGFGRGHR